MSDTIGALELDVAEARARLDQTIGAIQERLTPAGLVEELANTVSQARINAGFTGAIGLAKRNPLPLMIVAAGVGWYLHRLGRARQRLQAELDLPLLNTGHVRTYDPDVSTRHPHQGVLDSRRERSAQA